MFFRCLFLLLPAAVLLAQDTQIKESLEVKRIIVEVRVIDTKGRPITGLTAADFDLSSRGRDIPLLSVEWVEETQSARQPASLSGGEFFDEDTPLQATKDDEFWQDEPLEAARDTGGRLIVMMVQTDIGGHRNLGLMRFLRQADEIIENLADTDYVAVLSFDSSLKIHLDFSRDRDRVAPALEAALAKSQVDHPGRSAFPSIAAGLDRYTAFDVAEIERALLQVGKALKPFNGTKTIVLIGWGLGYWDGRKVQMVNYYDDMIAALHEAKATVFSLDISDADRHSLEVGLEQVASDTGGFYTRTHRFTSQAITKLVNSIAGHYVLVFEEPDLRGKEPAYKLKVRKKHDEILVRKPFNEIKYN